MAYEWRMNVGKVLLFGANWGEMGVNIIRENEMEFYVWG